MRLGTCSRGRENNFNVLRLAAASVVLISHSFVLAGSAQPSIGRRALGFSGVAIFFAVSGFLIAKSFDEDPDPLRYAVKRALRLLPALIVVVLLLGLVLGPLVSTRTASAYFGSFGVYRFLGQNSVLYTFSGGRLPGVFAHNSYPNSVDGSLWTLPVETIAYVGAALLGTLGALRGRPAIGPLSALRGRPAIGLLSALRGRRALGLLSLAILAILISPLGHDRSIAIPGPLHPILPQVLYLWAIFNAGLVLYAFRDRIALRWDSFGVLLVAWLIIGRTSWSDVAGLILFPYGVLVLAYRTPKRWNALTRPGDVSYGIYIYAFPVQQTIVYLWGPGLSPIGLLALAVVPVYLLAWGSWRLIESPALGLKRRLGRAADLRVGPIEATARVQLSDALP